MSDQTPPPVWTTEIPAQRAPFEHPMRPDGYVPVPPPTQVTADEPYAHWGQRAVALLIDAALQIPFQIAQFIGLAIAVDGGGLAWSEEPGAGLWAEPIVVTNANLASGTTWTGLGISIVAGLAGTVFTVWNMVFRQGRRGASIGKSCMNLMVVSETDGRPIGALMTFVRGWVHLIDLLTFGIGYLWPLWDRKRQTFADMIMKTAVLHLPPLPLPQTPQVPSQATAPYGW